MSTMSRLQLHIFPASRLQLHDLPEDILLRIGSFLLPLDIIRLRQTGKFMRDFTLKQILWKYCFHNLPNLFMPPIKLENLDHVKFERLLVLAQGADAFWKGNLHKSKLQRRLHLRNPGWMKGVRNLELYLGRYLLVGYLSTFILFDLDKVEWDVPIFHLSGDRTMESASLIYHTGYHRRSSMDCSGEIHIPILRMSTPSDSSIIVWKLCPGESSPLIEVDKISVNSPVSWVSIAYGYLIYHPEQVVSSYPVVYHIATRKRYGLEPVKDTMQNVWSDHFYHHEYIATEKYILAMHTGIRETVLEIFEKGDTDLLPRTHFGICPKGLTEPALISSTSQEVGQDSGIVVTVCLVANFHDDGLQAFSVLLLPDGTISFHLPSVEGPSSYGLTVSSNSRERARVASRSAKSSVTLLLHDIDFGKEDSDTSEVADVCATSIIIPELGDGAGYAWDGFRRRLCILAHDSHVRIIDFV